MFRYDETQPDLLIVYTGDEHATIPDYEGLVERWTARLAKPERFGIMIVYEPHEHHEDEDLEHNAEEHDAYTRLLNDFRRDSKDRAQVQMFGYAAVFPLEFKAEMLEKDAAAWENSQEQIDRFTQYMWAIPGRNFTDFDEAKEWLAEQSTREIALPPVEPPAPPILEGRVGLFFGSSTGNTEYVAFEIAKAWQASGQNPIEPINIGTLKDATALQNFDYLLLGIPTWNIGQLQDDWIIFLPQLATVDFAGKTVALFGAGDQYGYPDNFLDAIGILGENLQARGAALVGYWNDGQYVFAESRGFVEGKFMGLGIDEVNQSALTMDRIQGWVTQVIGELALQPSLA